MLQAFDRGCPFEVRDEILDIRMLIDRTSVEIFLDQGAVSLSACYLPRGVNHSLVLEVSHGRCRIPDLALARLKSAWI